MARTRTLAQLEADVLWQADREGTALRNASAQVRRAINQSIAEFREAVSESGDPYFLTKSQGSLSVGPTSPYHFALLDLSSLSPAHLRVYGFDVNVNGFWRSLDPAMFRERNDVQLMQAGGSSIPLQFFQFDRSSVGYAPASDAAYNYLLWYLPVHADLTADADAFDGMNGWEDWVVFNAVARLLLRDRDAHLERFEAERARILARVLHVARQRQRAGAHVRGGVRGTNDGRGRGRPDFLGGPGDGLNQPGSGEGGRVVRARSDGKLEYYAGDEVGQKLEWTGSVWIKKRGWITPDVDLTGAADATTAINSALASRAGACVNLPEGLIRTTGQLLISAVNNVTLTGNMGRGDGNGGTTLLVDAASGIDAIKLYDGQHNAVRNLYIRPTRVFTTGAAVKVERQTNSMVENVRIDSMCDGVTVLSSAGTNITQLLEYDLFGLRGLWFIGAAGAESHSVRVRDVGFDIPYRYAPAGNGAAIARSTTYAQGNVGFLNGNIYQCSTAGITAGTGGPSGIPTTDPATARTTEITDGSAKWVYVCNASMAHFSHGPFAFSSELLGRCGFLNGVRGIHMYDDVQAGNSKPAFLDATGLSIDHPFNTGVLLDRGAEVWLHDVFITSVFEKFALWKTSTFGEGLELEDVRCFGIAEHGMVFDSGYFNAQKCRVQVAGTRTSNAYDGMFVAAAVSNFMIANGTFGNWGSAIGPHQMRHGVSVATGASDHYQVRHNMVPGNLTAGVFDGGSGANKSVGDNIT